MQEQLPSVETIMEEIRSGLAGVMLSEETEAAAVAGSLGSDVCQAASAAGVLGRCGGSLRGRFCRLLAPFAHPVIEQLDLFHAAVVRALTRLEGESTDSNGMISRVDAIERRLMTLEKEMHRGKDPTEPIP